MGQEKSKFSIDIINYVNHNIIVKILSENRNKLGLSQRKLAELAGVSFGTVQLIESGTHSPNLKTLSKILRALGFAKNGLTSVIEEYLSSKSDSIVEISHRINYSKESSWKIWLFNFVDAFRRNPHAGLAAAPPDPNTGHKIQALLASSVESLCAETGIDIPWWCAGIPPLDNPWFVSETENLKATALTESPAHFRKRNIFVLDNFLNRA